MYGLDEEVLVTSHDEECERELHNEQFEEREGESQRIYVSPATEVLWTYERILQAGSVFELSGVVDVVKLGDFVSKSILPSSLCLIDWDSPMVFGTSNFFSTVVVPAGESISEFARLIDAVLLFEDGTNLLLSEYEADRVLQLLWTNKSAQPQFTFVNLSYAGDAIEGTREATALARDVPWKVGNSVRRMLDVSLTVLCQLYNGDTMFAKRGNGAVESALRDLLKALRKRETAFQEFATGRGNLLRWRYSFLHELCHEMDLGDFVTPQIPPEEASLHHVSAPATEASEVLSNRPSPAAYVANGAWTSPVKPKGGKAARKERQAGQTK